MHDIIKNEYSIGAIHNVLHNSMAKGYIRNDRTGRYSDCLVYILSGRTRYTFTDGRTMTAEPKDVLYLAKESLYCMDILTDTYEVIFVDFDFIISGQLYSHKFSMPKSENMELLFWKLNRKWILPTYSYKCECFTVLYTIYASLIQYFSQPYLPTASRDQLAPALEYISANYTNPELSICHLAEISGLSEGHFRRLFKNVFAASPNHYIRNLRIKYARQLLQYSTQNVSCIAELAGFQNAFYFCKVFKEETGYTPTEYRKSFRNI